MEVNAYILRAILARTDLNDEGAVNVGTSEKENLGGAMNVEEALRFLNESGADPSGFGALFPQLITQAFDPPPPMQGAGITVVAEGPVPRIHAKGRINFQFTDVGGVPYMDFQDYNIFACTLTGHLFINIMNTSLNQRFSIRLEQDGTGDRTVTWFPGITWAGGTAPGLTEEANRADWFGFIKIDENRYDGFVIGNNLH